MAYVPPFTKGEKACTQVFEHALSRLTCPVDYGKRDIPRQTTKDSKGGEWRMPVIQWRMLLVTLLGSLGVLGVWWHVARTVATDVAYATEHSPSQALTDGLQAFQRGDIAGAATSWQQAVQGYTTLQQPQARSMALTHLARAYEALGHTDRAEVSLRTALTLAEDTGDRTQVALVLGHLGDLAIAAGEAAVAESLVHDALAQARELNNVSLTATLLHTQGNLLMRQQHWPDALAAYRASAQAAAQVQQWGITARALAHAARAAERDDQTLNATALLGEALAYLRRAPGSHETAAELLFIGRAYQRLAHASPDLVLQARAAFQEAATLAQTLGDTRALSFAWGYLGRLYEEAQRYQEALALTRRAVLVAQQRHIPEALYRWQWQTGRLLRALGHRQAALAAYGRAVDTVETMHAALLRAQRGRHASFREGVGPLYLELADLLLQWAATLEIQEPAAVQSQVAGYLQQARATIERLKTVELRDYFGDACVAAARPHITALDHVASDAAVIYPILLADRTELVVSLPAGLKRFMIAVPGAQLERRARILRNALQARDPERYHQHAQRLYRWLLAPLEADLAVWPIQTLVFVPDGALRLIPFAVLHDGKQYLIEKYAVAITPSLTLTEPRPLSRDHIQALAAGLSSATAGFPALPHVQKELHALHRLYGGAVMLDQTFSPERLDTTLSQGRFGIVHIASHGRFASEATRSFLLTAQGKLTLTQLAQIVGRLRFRDQPLELLTLSACETAQGDDRAALGLAGVAIQAGARSALATLWRVADEATAVLMQEFYQHLQMPGMSRAQALRQAQLRLLHHPQYAAPFFWAPFLLLNNWL